MQRHYPAPVLLVSERAFFLLPRDHTPGSDKSDRSQGGLLIDTDSRQPRVLLFALGDQAAVTGSGEPPHLHT